jgi:hypothetical protein
MKESAYIFTRLYRFRQQMTLVFSVTILLFGLLSLLFDRGFWAWMSLTIVLLGLIATNLLASTLYKVQKEDKKTVVENMWRKKVYPIEALVEIRLLKFIVPYPFNPFVKFIFNDGKSFTGSISNALFIYLREGGIRRYLEKVRQQWVA